MTAPERSGPLAGLRVIEAGQLIAGLLAAMGYLSARVGPLGPRAERDQP
jgi:crotonobetainyl-CoA:carnitine CoA-transferase CaiB-like acyl-CoA transferase